MKKTIIIIMLMAMQPALGAWEYGGKKVDEVDDTVSSTATVRGTGARLHYLCWVDPSPTLFPSLNKHESISILHGVSYKLLPGRYSEGQWRGDAKAKWDGEELTDMWVTQYGVGSSYSLVGGRFLDRVMEYNEVKIKIVGEVGNYQFDLTGAKEAIFQARSDCGINSEAPTHKVKTDNSSGGDGDCPAHRKNVGTGKCL